MVSINPSIDISTKAETSDPKHIDEILALLSERVGSMSETHPARAEVLSLMVQINRLKNERAAD